MKVERVNTRRVTKRRRAQIEIVDWVLERRLEVVFLVALVKGLLLLLLLLLIMVALSSLAKKTRNRPIPQLSLLVFDLPEKPISDLSLGL